MLLLALVAFLTVLGLGALAAVGRSRWQFQESIEAVVLAVIVSGILWTTALLLPPLVSWAAAAVGVSALAFARTARSQQAGVLPLLAALGLAVLCYQFTASVLDLATSTRHFASDTALLLAALDRSVSASGLPPLAAVTSLTIAGALVGQWLGVQSRRSTHCVRNG
jgi:hypothetical protein